MILAWEGDPGARVSPCLGMDEGSASSVLESCDYRKRSVFFLPVKLLNDILLLLILALHCGQVVLERLEKSRSIHLV